MFSSENANKTVFSTLLGVGITLLLSLILILSAAFILSLTSDPRPLVMPLGLTILYLSAFAGGTVSAKISEGLISPALSGLITTALILLASLAYPGKGDMSAVIKSIAFSAIEISSLIGGIAYFFVATKRERRKKTKRRR